MSANASSATSRGTCTISFGKSRNVSGTRICSPAAITWSSMKPPCMRAWYGQNDVPIDPVTQ